MTRFVFAVGPSNAGPLQEITDFSQFTLSEDYDQGAEASWGMSGLSPAAAFVDELASDLWVYRDDVLHSRARIVQVGQFWTADGADTLACRAVDYKRVLNSRVLLNPDDYDDVPQDEIVWGLIQNVQAQNGGNYGITYTGTPSVVTRTRTEYESGDNCGQRLNELQAVKDGPFWRVQQDLELEVALWDDFPTQTVPVQMGATARSLNRYSGASKFANAVFLDGDDAATVPEIRESPTLGTDPRGRWDLTQSYTSVTRQDTLASHADGFLQQVLSPPAQWQAEIEPSRWVTDANYAIGDFVTVVVPPSTVAPIGGPGNVIVAAQVVNVSYTITANGLTGVAITALEVGS